MKPGATSQTRPQKQIKVSISSEEYCFGVDFEPIANYLLALFVFCMISLVLSSQCLQYRLLCQYRVRFAAHPPFSRQRFSFERYPAAQRSFNARWTVARERCSSRAMVLMDGQHTPSLFVRSLRYISLGLPTSSAVPFPAAAQHLFSVFIHILWNLFVVIPIHGDIECLREGFRLLLCCGKAEIILPPGGGERQAYRISRETPCRWTGRAIPFRLASASPRTRAQRKHLCVLPFFTPQNFLILGLDFCLQDS